MVSPGTKRRGTNHQAGDERNFGAAGGRDGGSPGGRKTRWAGGRAVDRCDAVQHGGFRAVGLEGAADGERRLQAELSFALDAQGPGVVAGFRKSTGSSAAGNGRGARSVQLR